MAAAALMFFWGAYIVYIARTSEDRRQLHLAILWGLMLLPTLYVLGRGLWRWLAS
jgi:hypothetical protein